MIRQPVAPPRSSNNLRRIAAVHEFHLGHTFTVTACHPRVSVDEGRLAVPMGEG